MLARAVQYSVTLDGEKRQVARKTDCTVAYRYDKEGNLTKKTVTHADGIWQTVYYETNETGKESIKQKIRFSKENRIFYVLVKMQEKTAFCK